ncbi:LysM peptidoglycan-binding domain-containing protein [Lutibacter sp.]|uniref:LysM peptidoglycan-binding domain-containing protein n=1 Tax=Lutibacter sp. TaxID=1925666 RepID=UPI002734FC4A|nr:LysM peptidoglycan-binding domain-containing protein [Lutibacter sp.]MDP3313007.1 LysM peptidoglycan-binding domain-containing protein [Lutibacter sp.]
MKKINTLLICLLMLCSIALAQQKKYISYIVKQGETIKSIAKENDLSTRDLLNLNPDVSRNPSVGTTIIIPNKNFGKFEAKDNETTSTHKISTPLNTFKYIVVKDDTVYNLTKRFGITELDLLENNAVFIEGVKEGKQLKDLLQLGMELNILKPNTNVIINYIVVKDDTVYNLTKRFGVTAEDLKALNPSLEEGLKLGMELKIKSSKPLDSVVVSSGFPKRIINGDNNVNVKGQFIEKINFNKTIDLVLLLPYNISTLNDSIKRVQFNNQNSLLSIATDFHLGAEIAIDSLKQKGLRINVKYLDSENSTRKLQQQMANHNLNEADVIIGPLFFENAHWLSKNVRVPIIAPFFSKKQDLLSDDNLVKSAPDLDILEVKLLAFLKRSYKGETIIVINDGKEESQRDLWKIVGKLKEFNSNGLVSVIKPENGYINANRITEKLSHNKDNWVFLISEDNITTASTLNALKGVWDKLTVNLITLNKGSNFDNVDNNLLGKLNFTYPSADYLYTDDKNTKVFFEKYITKNHVMPSKYAIRGFDITYDAIVRAASAPTVKEGLLAGKSVRISSVFKYDKKESGSFENSAVFIIQYNKELVPMVVN